MLIHKETGKPWVFKIIWKRIYNSEERQYIKSNIEILKRLDHPNLIKLHEFYSDKKNYYLISEYVEGFTLPNYFINSEGITEWKASVIAW